MKFFFALASIALAAVANADQCDLAKIAPLISDPNVKQCTTDSGFSPPIPPSDAILPKLCANKACAATLTTLKGLGLGDCTLAGVKFETDLVDPILKACLPAPAPASVIPLTSTPSTATAPGQ